ncbi:hypothetical protein [Limnothrix sp. FACHB-881]|uniref:hypothetical protein n=1 Tax=Limnothrix sp. FACHB-881 TaxID=2692819 RepID=UPI001687CEDA|nr:hypothetical protein [Limnothrix sp. FACHB-881]
MDAESSAARSGCNPPVTSHPVAFQPLNPTHYNPATQSQIEVGQGAEGLLSNRLNP